MHIIEHAVVRDLRRVSECRTRIESDSGVTEFLFRQWSRRIGVDLVEAEAPEE